MNNVVLIGRLTRDPELRYIPNSGVAVTNFTLAVDKQLPKDKRQEMEAKNQPTADFIRITVWGKTAENCAQYLYKGAMAGIQGRIQTGVYETPSGEKRNSFEVVANYVEFLSENKSSSNATEETKNDPVEEAGFVPVEDDDLPF